jgi:serine/threonine protein phosphatase PrpC
MSVYKSFAVTVTGISHIKHDKGCEDSSFKHEDAGLSIAVVADGHGDDNCFRSAKGSQLAVACAVKGIQEFVKFHESNFSSGFPWKKNIPPTQDDFEKAIRDLVKHIIALWQVKVEEDYTVIPFTVEELEKADIKHRKKYETDGNTRNKAYGTTLITATITPYYWFGIHIGDGRLTALYSDGTFDQPVPWDEKCFLNMVTSICDDDAYIRARCYFSYHNEKAPPVAVFLCSDGIDDNYPVDENEKHLFKLYRTIATTFVEDGFDSTCKQLNDLANSFATKGKGDDTSIAGIVDMEAMKKAVPNWRQQIAEEEVAEKIAEIEKQVKAETEHEKQKKSDTLKESEAKALKTIEQKRASEAYKYQMDTVKDNTTDYGIYVIPSKNGRI